MMRKALSLFRLLAVFAPAIVPCRAVAGSIAPELAARLPMARGDERVAVLIFVRDAAGQPRIEREPRALLRSLRSRANVSQIPLLAFLKTWNAAKVRPLWVVNAVAAELTAAAIRAVADRPDVVDVSWDRLYTSIAARPIEDRMVRPRAVTVPWNISRIGADKLWAEGYDGTGIRVGVIDTGADTTHPDLAGRMVTGGWFDAVNGSATPYDDYGHGTHVTGILCGGASSGTAVGVAPGARFLAAKALDNQNRFQGSWVLAAGQWMADPNGDGDPSDAPQIINCSWSYDDRLVTAFEPLLSLWRSEGIWPVFCAGNVGPGANTAAAPGNDPLAMEAGATDSSDTIWNQSARGPAPPGPPWNGILKPELVAPGVFVRSCLPKTLYPSGYGAWTGTSMAAPHVAGALAILRQAHPGISFNTARARLEAAALDLGVAGPDTSYGYGRLDAYAAFHLVSGDADGDGTLSLNDAMTLARIAGGLSPATLRARAVADVAPASNGDGLLSLGDAVRTLRGVEGLDVLP